MPVVPGVGVLAPHPREVRTDAAGAPLERMVVDGPLRLGDGAVAGGLPGEGADHLAVAGVATLLDVDVPPLELEGGVGDLLGAAELLGAREDGRQDLGHATDEDRDDGDDREDHRAALEQVVDIAAIGLHRVVGLRRIPGFHIGLGQVALAIPVVDRRREIVDLEAVAVGIDRRQTPVTPVARGGLRRGEQWHKPEQKK